MNLFKKSNSDEGLNNDFPKKVLAMKWLTLLKNISEEAFNASLPRFIALSMLTLYKFMKKSPLKSAGVSDTMWKMTKFLAFDTKIYNLFLKFLMKIIASLFLCINIFL